MSELGKWVHEDGDQAAVEVSLAEPPPKAYRLEWYKNGKNYGVKQCFAGRKQILSVGGKKIKKTRKQLRKLAERAVRRMVEEGASEEATKAWAKEQLQK